jgi:protein O-mannosyl-transferase
LASTRKSLKQKKNQSRSPAPKKPEAIIPGKGSKQKEPDRKKTIYSRPILKGPWYINALIFLLLIIAGLLVYSGDLHLGFFRIDDQQYVVNNQWIRGFSSQNLHYIFTTPYFVNYSPLHLLSYMFDYSFAGADGYVFHLSSNLWAGVVAGFVFLTALALTGRRIIAIAAAILFVVHPSHVEAVAWISSRKDLVAAAFALPSLLAYLYYRRGGKAAKRWYILSLLLFFLALL